MNSIQPLPGKIGDMSREDLGKGLQWVLVAARAGPCAFEVELLFSEPPPNGTATIFAGEAVLKMEIEGVNVVAPPTCIFLRVTSPSKWRSTSTGPRWVPIR